MHDGRQALKPRRITVPQSKFAIAALAALWLVQPAGGQAAEQNLSSLPGQSPLQNRVGSAVTTVCGGLAAAGTNRNGPSSTEDLFGRCQDLVQTANEIAGSGPTTFSLGLSSDETNEALLQVSHDEAAAINSNTTEVRSSQTQAIAGRLGALRHGATGFSIAGLTIEHPDPAFGRTTLAALMPRAGGMAADATAGENVWDFGGRLGGFLSGTVGFADVDGSSEEAGYDTTFFSLTLGADYRFNDNLVLGTAVGYSNNDSDFDGGGGDLTSDAVSFTAYGTYQVTDRIFVDGSFGYTYQWYDMNRRIVYPSVARTAKGNTNGDSIHGSLGGGMDFTFNGLTLTPIGNLDYIRSDIDSFTESGAGGLNLAYGDQTIESFTTSLGVEASYPMSTDFGVVVAQARAAWVHEFSDDSKSINVRYAADPSNTVFSVITDDPTRDYANAGVALVVVWPGGYNGFLSYDTALGIDGVSVHIVSVGFRIEL